MHKPPIYQLSSLVHIQKILCASANSSRDRAQKIHELPVPKFREMRVLLKYVKSLIILHICVRI